MREPQESVTVALDDTFDLTLENMCHSSLFYNRKTELDRISIG